MLTRGMTGCLAVMLAGILGCGGLSNGGDRKAAAATQGKDGKAARTENFDPANFDRSTTIDNEWFPLKPGTRRVWEGTRIDDEGDQEDRRAVVTVTDLTKEIGGVRTAVCWNQDFADGELVETELIFFAQDKGGVVWHLGQYPEEHEDGNTVATPCWIHGIKDGKAGIIMHAQPKLGTPSYSQGFGPSVRWMDRGQVYEMGQKVTVPYGSYEDVLVIDETTSVKPDSHQLKYYARGVGNIKVGWRGEDKTQETLELVKVEKLSAEELAKVRDEVLNLEKNAYELSKDVYAQTAPTQ